MLTYGQRRSETTVDGGDEAHGAHGRAASSLLDVVLVGDKVAEAKAESALILAIFALAALFLLLDDGRDLLLVDDGGRLLGEVDIGTSVGGRRRGGRGDERGALIPHELDELVLEVAGGRDDLVEVVSPSDEDTLVTLSDDGC